MCMKLKFFKQSLGIGMLGLICLLGNSSATSQNAPHRIEVVAKKFAYSPSEVTLRKGEPTVLVLTSQDVAHGLKFKDLDLDTDIKKDATSDLAFTPTKVGDFVGHCSHFCGP